VTGRPFDVFVSYNSQDRKAVLAIVAALQRRDLRVAIDIRELVPGRPWQEALEEVLATVPAVIVACGPNGWGPWQTVEMRAAIDQSVARGMAVIPLSLPESSGPNAFPLFLRRYTGVDSRLGVSDDVLSRLQWGISGARPADVAGEAVQPGRVQGALFGVPHLPPHAVPRPREIERLRTLVLGAAHPRVGVVGALRAGLYGMGGIGKSVLATMIAHDTAVRDHFVDGIYWITAGRDADVTRLQAHLARYLGEPEPISDAARGKQLLTSRLEPATCLLVLDDVWEDHVVEGLDVLGNRGCLLVTTRVASTAATIGALTACTR